MKKYHQLILTICAVFGTLFFLYYKHEYNRLYAVLEVLDTFGSNRGHGGQEISAKRHFIPKNNRGSWRQLGDVYLFSTHVINNLNTKIQVVSVGVSFSDFTSECLIWYDEEKNSTGKISIEFLDYVIRNEHYVPAVVTCSSKEVIENPFAVTISSNINGKKYEQVVPVNTYAREFSEDEISICALLPDFITNKLEVIEFIEFHSIVGISSIFLYVNSLSPRMENFFHEYREKLSLNVTIIPWSPPQTGKISSDVIKTTFRNDCLLRSRAVSKYVIISNVNQILIPRYHDTIQEVLIDVRKVSSEHRAYLQLNSKLFCTEKSDNFKFIPRYTTLLKTWWISMDTATNYSLIDNHICTGITTNFTIKHPTNYREYLIPNDVILLHKYESCPKIESTLQHDPVAQKFKNKLFETGLIHFAMS